MRVATEAQILTDRRDDESGESHRERRQGQRKWRCRNGGGEAEWSGFSTNNSGERLEHPNGASEMAALTERSAEVLKS